MEISAFSPFTSASSTNFSVPFLFLHAKSNPSKAFAVARFRISCSEHAIQIDTLQPHLVKVPFEATRRRKPRPSFLEQVQEKWSAKITSSRERFPWQGQLIAQLEQEEGGGNEDRQSSDISEIESDVEKIPSKSDVTTVAPLIRSASAPWAHGRHSAKPHVELKAETSDESMAGEDFDALYGNCRSDSINGVMKTKYSDGIQDREDVTNVVEISRDYPESGISTSFSGAIGVTAEEKPYTVGEESGVGSDNDFNCSEDERIGGQRRNSRSNFRGRIGEQNTNFTTVSGVLSNEKPPRLGVGSGFGCSGLIELPWKRDEQIDSGEGDNWIKSNTALAERMLPEHELRRLRNIALRMLERIKVGVAGITQALVDSIHEKWRTDEVVKLKFVSPLSFNMKRTHELLESKTGGLVIWRSGSSIVLYRGAAYNLPCVQQYAKKDQSELKVLNNENDMVSGKEVDGTFGTTNLVAASASKPPLGLSERELMNLTDLNNYLDELGPRFKDWSGCEPLPVDADLLPAVVFEYKPPLRLLPYRVRHCLTNKQMTTFRRLARTMTPHFALGRNRELQGLARAIVKLWERSAIAKIAIKRGVENTRNERMAEELKRLTGGVLLSRNKDYIVFYRGNDFLPPTIMDVVNERRELGDLRQDEEEQARLLASASIETNNRTLKGSFLAGTFAETMAATSRWGSQPSSEDIENMMRDSALARHVSLIRYTEKRLALAKGKLKKADMALAKVQENLDPTDLPTDLETISNEERFLFRRIGLSMKPFLLLGRRGVYDGTIENMHLHWKFRELVKIIVRGKSFDQVKHIAISLEAESGGVLVSLDKVSEGYVVIIYRGKNYSRPDAIRPKNLLTRRQAFARSIELQRREALRHHIVDLEEKIVLLKSELEEMRNGKKVDEAKALS